MNIPRFLRRESQPLESREELNAKLESLAAQIQQASAELEALPDKLHSGLITPGEYTLKSQYLEQLRDSLLNTREGLLSRIDKLGNIAAQTAFRQM